MNAPDAWSDIDLSGAGEDQLLGRAAAHIRQRSNSLPPGRRAHDRPHEAGEGRAKRLARPKTMAIFRRQLAVQHELGLNRPSPTRRAAGPGTIASIQTSTSANDYTEVESEALESTPILVYFLTLMSGIGGFLFGYDTGIVSGAMPKVAKDFKIEHDPLEQELIVSATVLFAIVGALLGDRISGSCGRKAAILLASGIFTVGALMVAAATSVSFMVFGRAVLGIAVGLSSQAVPMYLAEIAPPHLRGGIISFFNASITIGQVIACIVAGLLCEMRNGWRWMMGLAALPALVQLFGMMFLPESPRWLTEQKQSSEALEVLKALRHNDKQATTELSSIEQDIRAEQEAKDTGADKQSKEAFKTALTLGCGLMVLQQLCGINTVMYYSASIFKMTGVDDTTAIWLTVLPAMANATMSSCSMVLIDWFGRRALAMGSLSLVALALLCLSAAFHYMDLMTPAHRSVSVIAAMMFYVVAFGSGMSPIPWVVNGEIYSLKYRSLGQSLATVTNWSCNFIVSMTFLSLCRALDTGNFASQKEPNPAAAFLVYAAIAEVGFIFVYYRLPETSGVTLEEMQKLFITPDPSTETS